MEEFRKSSVNTTVLLLIVIFLLKGAVLAALVPYWQSSTEFFEGAYVHLMAEKKRAPSVQDSIPPNFQLAYKKAFFPDFPPESVAVPDLPSIQNNPYYLFLSVIAFLGKPLGYKIELFLLRLISVFLGASVIWIAYLLVKLLFPKIELFQFTVPILIAFHPQYSLVSSRVGIINFYIFTFTLLLFLIIKNSFEYSKWAVLGIGIILILGVPPEHRLLLSIPVLSWLLMLFFFQGNLKNIFKFIEKRVFALSLVLLTFIFGWFVIHEISLNLFQIRLPALLLDFFDSNVTFTQLKVRFWSPADAGIVWNSFSNVPSILILSTLNFITNLALAGFLIWLAVFCWPKARAKKLVWPSVAEVGVFLIFIIGLVAGSLYRDVSGLFYQAASFLKLFSLYGLLILLIPFIGNNFGLKPSAFSLGDQRIFFALILFFLFLVYGLKIMPPQTLERESYALISIAPWFVFFALGMFQWASRRWTSLVVIVLVVFLAGLNILVLLSVVIPKYYRTLDQFILGSSGSQPLLPVALICLVFSGLMGTCLIYLNRLMEVEMVTDKGKKNNED